MDLTALAFAASSANTVQISYYGDRGVAAMLLRTDEVATRAEVGRGNSGVVHVVTLLDGSQYYVKTVSGGDPAYHRREIEINMYLTRHAAAAPFVSRFLAGFIIERDGQTCATQVFQYLPGVNALEYLRRLPSQRNVVRRAAIHALRSIHEAGIQHGDVGLSNLFIAFGARGQISVRFIDFGGARRSYSESAHRNNLQRLERAIARGS
jgi:serine/threonine protein kinase